MENGTEEGQSPKQKRFKPPTLEEVREYAKEKGRVDLAEKFYNFYTADENNLWCSNGKKIKSWKQKFMTWVMHDKQGQNKQEQKGSMWETLNKVFEE